MLMMLLMLREMVVVVDVNAVFNGIAGAERSRFDADGSLLVDGRPTRETSSSSSSSSSSFRRCASSVGGSEFVGLWLVELWDGVHDNAEEREIEGGDSRAAFPILVARVHVVRGEQAAHQVHSLEGGRIVVVIVVVFGR